MKHTLLTSLLLLFFFGLRAQCVPGPIVGPSAICIASTSTLTDTVAGGVWSSSAPTIASIESATGIVHALTHGSATISYTLCGTGIATHSINVDTAVTSITITGPSGICVGTLNTFTGTPTGGSWSVTPSFIATISAFGDLVSVAAGTFTLTYITTNSCGLDTLNTTLTSLSTPYAGDISGANDVFLGREDSLTTSGMTSGTWSVSPASIATIIPAGSFHRLIPLSVGTAIISYNISTPCGTSIDIDSFTVLNGVGTSSDSFTSYHSSSCLGLSWTAYSSSSSSAQIVSLYGDGTRDTATIAAHGTAAITHPYSSSGTYTVKQIFYLGSTPVDSLNYSAYYVSCQDISINFYFDNDSNCHSGDSLDISSAIPIVYSVDSSGITIDTLSATSGLYYRTYGSIGTIYTFRPISTSPYYTISCPSSGIIYDTVTSGGFSVVHKEVALKWITGAAFDLSISSTFNTGRHAYYGYIILHNYCNTTSASLSLDFNPRYLSTIFSPTPTSISGHIATWNISSITAGADFRINASLDVFGGTSTWFTPGDTIVSRISATPTAGDRDTTNNYVVRIDTAKSSWDPNYTAVTPEGYIHNNTKLHYTVHFENDGNDTARNIYVLDTLPDNVDPSTLRIETATAAMYVSYLHFGSHTVVKFDFPGINLPDSSHHGYCTGFVQFNVMTRSGLADGTVLPDRAGIYFDDNEVILTNTVTNTILIPSISIASSAGSTICAGDTARFTATTHTTPNTHYQWYVNSTAVGADTTHFSSTTLATGNVVKCVMRTGFGDTTMVLNSGTITMTVNPLPVSGTISGPASVCSGATVTLSSTGTGGSWTATNGHATVSGPFVTGVAAGLDTIMYRVTNSCGTATAMHIIRVDSSVTPAISISVTPAGAVCAGDTVTFTATVLNGGSAPSLDWKLFGTSTGDTANTHTYVPLVGDVVTCALTSNALCAIPPTTTSSGITMVVNPSVTPTISITATTDSITLSGQFVTFYATATYGGSATTFQWYVNGTAVAGATNASYSLGVVHDISVYCIMTSNAPCATSGTANSNIKTVAADYLDVTTLASINGITLAPNPNKGSFKVTAQVTDASTATIQVVDITGRIVYTAIADPENGQLLHTILLHDAPPGNYYLRIVQGDKVSFSKFIVQ